ncbi:MAG: hypothetical protein WKF75_05060 [Singulisphaera sp.]
MTDPGAAALPPGRHRSMRSYGPRPCWRWAAPGRPRCARTFPDADGAVRLGLLGRGRLPPGADEQVGLASAALMRFREAVSALHSASSFFASRTDLPASVLGSGREGADRTLLHGARLQVIDLGNLAEAGSVSKQSRAVRVGAISEVDVEWKVLDARIDDGPARDERRRRTIDDLLFPPEERPESSLDDWPPRLKVRVAAVALELRLDPRPERYLRALIDALRAIRLPAARLVALEHLEASPALEGVPYALTDDFVSLLPTVAGLRESGFTPAERGRLLVRLTEALRIAGRDDDASEALSLAWDDLIEEGRGGLFSLPELLRAWDRLGRHEEASRRGGSQAAAYLKEFDDSPILCASFLADQAERDLWFGLADLVTVDQTLTSAEARLADQPSQYTGLVATRLARARDRLKARAQAAVGAMRGDVKARDAAAVGFERFEFFDGNAVDDAAASVPDEAPLPYVIRAGDEQEGQVVVETRVLGRATVARRWNYREALSRELGAALDAASEVPIVLAQRLADEDGGAVLASVATRLLDKGLLDSLGGDRARSTSASTSTRLFSRPSLGSCWTSLACHPPRRLAHWPTIRHFHRRSSEAPSPPRSGSTPGSAGTSTTRPTCPGPSRRIRPRSDSAPGARSTPAPQGLWSTVGGIATASCIRGSCSWGRPPPS